MLELTIISESGQPVRRLELMPGTSLKIGRARECDIRVTSPTVSRHHAEVVDNGNGWTFRDTNSTHGSVVRGQKVREVDVTPGLEVRIGPTLFRFDNLASRIGRELDQILEEEEARGGPVSVEIIGRDGRHTTTLDDTLLHGHPHVAPEPSEDAAGATPATGTLSVGFPPVRAKKPR